MFTGAGADQEIIVSVGEGEAQAWLMFKSSFTYFLQFVPIDHSKGTKISQEGGWGESKKFRRCGVGMGCGGPHTYS